jgi:hypothetical protein
MNLSSFDKNASRTFPRVIVACVGVLTFGCSQSPAPAAKEAAPAAVQPAGLQSDTKLPTFAQDISTTVKTLTLKTGQTIKIPVTVHNTGTEAWSPAGKAPVNFSYRWYVGTDDRVLETARTLLPRPLLPDQSFSFDATINAPMMAGRYTLRLSMVQEGIEWFVKAGGKATDIPVEVK